MVYMYTQDELQGRAVQLLFITVGQMTFIYKAWV